MQLSTKSEWIFSWHFIWPSQSPFRPIVSSVNTYNYNLANLVSILQPISTNQYTVKDSCSFTDWAKKHKHNNGIMCSLDVSSLFTTVPLEETLNICLDKLYSLADPPALPSNVAMNAWLPQAS